jgi:large subunit ribosomal protein L27
MAHKKSGGTAQANRDTSGKRLGVKIFGGQKTFPGNILIRQRGTKFYPGIGTAVGKDHTIFSKTEGIVSFAVKKGKKLVNIISPN